MKPAIVFIWENFGPYHVDRLEAAAAALEPTHRVIGIEIAGSSSVYAWDRTESVAGVERITLFPGRLFATVPAWRQLSAMLRACLKARAPHIFLCHVTRPDTFILAVILRLLGRRVYVMTESKFDDKPRRLGLELFKKVIYLPYRAALAGGARHRDYLRFLGFGPASVALGYDTVSMDRVRRLAGAPPAPGGIAHAQRHFTIVARLVSKKNLAMALEAYAQYCQAAGPSARELHFCGSGDLDVALREQARELGLTKAVFRGFIQAPEVAQVLASTLALILPSTEEQWGLVINEANAMGVPVLCSLNVGARDLLVRTGVNGFIFEPDNPAGLAYFMQRLAADEPEWRRLAEGSLRLAPLADTSNFGAAVAHLIQGRADRETALVPSAAPASSEDKTRNIGKIEIAGEAHVAVRAQAARDDEPSQLVGE